MLAFLNISIFTKMNSVTGYIVICMLLLTALIYLIVLLINMTERQEMYFEEPYGRVYSSAKALHYLPKSDKFYKKYNKILTTTQEIIKSTTFQQNFTENLNVSESTIKSYWNSTNKYNEIFLNKTMKILPDSFSKNNARYIGILVNSDQVLLPKDNGEIEIFKENKDGLLEKTNSINISNENQTQKIDKFRLLNDNFYTTTFALKIISKFDYKGILLKKIYSPSEIIDMNVFGKEVN